MKALNNTVIKNLSLEMGKRIIAKYQADGWDVRDISGSSIGEGWSYYGVINDRFNQFRLEQVQSSNARIIDLDEFIPKRGDMVMVWDDDASIVRQRLPYLTTIEGSEEPFFTVHHAHITRFQEGSKFEYSSWKHMKPISDPDIKAQIQAQYEIMQKLINKI
jgi:hypothetical protein